ncbi:dipeptide ABC transporter ATP-binding protein [Rhodococcus wratislaviensis]|uniref:dipeptide ABC transporter ATP-binding protein n=1 Tax=Rhodococcus wratislaviensis TaxID=44752 RepID=UPI00365A1067
MNGQSADVLESAVDVDADVRVDATSQEVLLVEELSVELSNGKNQLELLSGLTFTLRAGETFGVVGESGCGKSLTAMAVMGSLPPGGTVSGGSIRLLDRELVGMNRKDLDRLRGRDIAYVSQEAKRSLNPALTVGRQITEVLQRHRGMNDRQAKARAVEMLDRVGIRNAPDRLNDYPHQFSGGMAQRVMIAMALACEPKVLIADEPTTALDATVQLQVLQLLKSLQRDMGLAIILITHDLSVVAEMCDRAMVMYAGQVVEIGPTAELFHNPRHPYTAGLLASVALPKRGQGEVATIRGVVPSPRDWTSGCRFQLRCAQAEGDRCAAPTTVVEVDRRRSVRCHRVEELELVGLAHRIPERNGAESWHPQPVHSEQRPILTAVALTKTYPPRGMARLRNGAVTAVDHVDISVNAGETLAVVGESGAGKSTLGRLVLRLIDPDSGVGSLRLGDVDLQSLSRSKLRAQRGSMQMIFQDPFSSLDPKMSIQQTVCESLLLHTDQNRAEREKTARSLLNRVGIRDEQLDRYPHELSGGQLQRVAIARAIANSPSLIVCDEPVAALDVSIRAQVIKLLRDLQEERNMAYLFITHDLSLVQMIADRVAVMFGGKIVEQGVTEEVFTNPQHPHTKLLLDSVLSIDPLRPTIGSRVGGGA